MCKIAVNLMLAVVNENMMEITLLAQKAGVPRHAFLEFLNNSVMGSTFTRYKTPALRQSRLDDDLPARPASARTSISACRSPASSTCRCR